MLGNWLPNYHGAKIHSFLCTTKIIETKSVYINII